MKKHHKKSIRKQDMAEKAVRLIDEVPQIFLGPGTTIGNVMLAMNNQRLQVVTNCLPHLQHSSRKK